MTPSNGDITDSSESCQLKMTSSTKATQCSFQRAISLAHEGSHPGQNAIKRRLKTHFWFPGMDNAIKLQVENCHECQKTTATPIKAPLTSTPIPEKSWQNISIDLFGPLLDQRHIQVVRCNISRFPDAKIVRSTRTQYVLPALGKIYENFGNPECHNCVNGPPFNGQEFHDWSIKRGIKIRASYPITHREMKLNASWNH